MQAAEALRAGQELLGRLTDPLPVGVLQFGADASVAYRNEWSCAETEVTGALACLDTSPRLPGCGTSWGARPVRRRGGPGAIGVPLLVDGVRLAARASVGTARSDADSRITSADTPIAAADDSMYRVKTPRRATGRP